MTLSQERVAAWTEAKNRGNKLSFTPGIPMASKREGNRVTGKADLRLHERPEQPALLKQPNDRHAVVYAERRQKLAEQLTETTLEIAMDQMHSEARRGAPIQQWSFEVAIDDAARASARVTSKQARRGGRKKTDTLQGLIIEIVRQKPEITVSQLLQGLRKMKGEGVIDDVDDAKKTDGAIYFMKQSGRNVEAPLSASKTVFPAPKKLFATISREADSASPQR